MMIVLDSNILVRAVDRGDPLHACTRAALKALYRQGDVFCFFPQQAAEFWNVCTRPSSARGGLGLTIEETGRYMAQWHRLCDIYHDLSNAYDRWRVLVSELRLTGAHVYDARIVALMQAYGLTHVLTHDGGFRRYKGITALSPQDFS